MSRGDKDFVLGGLLPRPVRVTGCFRERRCRRRRRGFFAPPMAEFTELCDGGEASPYGYQHGDYPIKVTASDCGTILLCATGEEYRVAEGFGNVMAIIEGRADYGGDRQAHRQGVLGTPVSERGKTMGDDSLIYILDLDGTLTNTDHRQHFLSRKKPGAGDEGGKDWDRFHAACVDDPPNEPLCRIARHLPDRFRYGRGARIPTGA